MSAQQDAGGKVKAQVERDLRHNFLVNVLDGASFWFGISFISTTVILPLYVSHFTSNPLLIGMIPFLSTAGYLLPPLFMANRVERAPLKKYFPVTLGFFLQRLPMILFFPAAFLLAGAHPAAALWVFLGLYAWHSFGAGIVGIGWQDMIAKVIPVTKRGRFFGLTNFVGNGAGILGALAVPLLLERSGFPDGFVLAFAIAAVFTTLSWFFLSQTREPRLATGKPPVSQAAYLRSLPQVLRRDANFRTYLLAQIVFSLSGMATGFLVVYSVKTWSLPDATASGYTIALQVGLTLSTLVFGFLADRRGHKLILEICMLLSVLALVLAIAAPGPLWFLAVLFLRGVVNTGTFMSGVSIVYEFTGEADRPTYIGLASTLPGIAAGLAPLLGGWLAQAAGYQAMFIAAAVIGAVSLGLLRFAVREPRREAPLIHPRSN